MIPAHPASPASPFLRVRPVFPLCDEREWRVAAALPRAPDCVVSVAPDGARAATATVTIPEQQPNQLGTPSFRGARVRITPIAPAEEREVDLGVVEIDGDGFDVSDLVLAWSADGATLVLVMYRSIAAWDAATWKRLALMSNVSILAVQPTVCQRRIILLTTHLDHETVVENTPELVRRGWINENQSAFHHNIVINLAPDGPPSVQYASLSRMAHASEFMSSDGTMTLVALGFGRCELHSAGQVTWSSEDVDDCVFSPSGNVFAVLYARAHRLKVISTTTFKVLRESVVSEKELRIIEYVSDDADVLWVRGYGNRIILVPGADELAINGGSHICLCWTGAAYAFHTIITGRTPGSYVTVLGTDRVQVSDPDEVVLLERVHARPPKLARVAA